MPEPASPKAAPWPNSVATVLLAVLVAVQAFFWLSGFYALFGGDLPAAGTWLSAALVVLLLGGWLWRWLVAMGKIGGRPTARFGGASTD